MRRTEKTRIRLLLLLVALALGSGCDDDEGAPPKPASETPPSKPAEQVPPPVAKPDPSPAPEEPAKPDFEDAAGTVEQLDGRWVIVTDEDPSRRLCLPADTPADSTEKGAKVRFTLYLEPRAEDERHACLPVKTLVSMRRAD